MTRYLAELLGTFALVFFGTGAIIVNEQSGGVLTHVGIAISFGLVIMTMIYALGDVSGAHFNPAVTIGFALAKRLEIKQVLPYILCQVAGAFLASGILCYLFPPSEALGTTMPAGDVMQ